jgi:ankyrin repeat protein
MATFHPTVRRPTRGLAAAIVVALVPLATTACGHHPPADIARAGTEADLLAMVAREPGAASAKDRFGKTALHYAAKRGLIGAVRRLARDRAGVDARDGDGQTPLFLAVHGSHVECAYELLLAGADPQSRNGPVQDTPMHGAAEVHALPIAQLLRRWGAPVDSTNRWGQTPLHVAAAQAWHGDTAVAAWLLEQGARADARDALGFSPLQTAAFHNNLPVFELLASRGASLEEQTACGSTLLDLAVERNEDAVAQYLFEHHQPTARATDAVPPLHLAARMNDPAFAASLLASGATPDFPFHGETALQIAERQGHREIASLLRTSVSAQSELSSGAARPSPP